ncbi:hypothetical protein LOK49_LG15G01938 [Camellia lanceoleosa]|uniref:Uncharacterized protein n=1 Tax=Camellia lanceoleosa TaxID=1840588 RepID=A0ACC0F248_9ERIC|nr:hypothetical protein LOK49_LG15G01938 [Camellia lanceoleosa]
MEINKDELRFGMVEENRDDVGVEAGVNDVERENERTREKVKIHMCSSEFGYLSYSLPHTRLRRHSVRACGRDRFARIRRHCAVSNHSTEDLP